MKKIVFLLSVVFIIALMPIITFAAPVENQIAKLTQPDGTEFVCYVSGDEFFNYYHDADGNLIKQSDSGWYEYCINADGEIAVSGVRVGENPPENALTKDNVYDIAEEIIEESKAMYAKAEEITPQILNASGTNFDGDFNNIVIFICFSDQSPTLDTYISSNIDKIYNTGYTPDADIHGEISVNDYFNVATNGHINVNTSFYPTDSNGTVYCYQDSNPTSYYQPRSASNTNGYRTDSARTSREFTLLANAVNSVSASIPSDLNLDANKDGYVDSISFIIATESGGWSDLLWSHQWAIYSKSVYLNGSRVYTFSFTMLSDIFTDNSSVETKVENYLGVDIQTKVLRIGTICHEMMHAFGMPDLYDYVNQSNIAIGYYDLMANNNTVPQLQTTYTRERWGIYATGKSWVDGLTQTVTSGKKQTFTLNTVSTNSGVIALKIPYSLTGYTASNIHEGDGGRTVYIEYRGINSPYECERISGEESLSQYTLSGSQLYWSPYYIGADTGLLVYETDLNIEDNTRNEEEDANSVCSPATKDCYTLWAYRKNATLTDCPVAHGDDEGNIYVSLTNGVIIKISNIDEAEDKSYVVFDLEIFVNGDPEQGADESIKTTEQTTAEQFITFEAANYISWGSDTNSAYFNGTPSTDNGLSIYVTDANGNTIDNTAYIGTGYKLKITSSAASNLDKEITIAIYGDINGDTKINIIDLLAVKRYLNGSSLSEIQLIAADTDGCEGVTKKDLISIHSRIFSSAN